MAYCFGRNESSHLVKFKCFSDKFCSPFTFCFQIPRLNTDICFTLMVELRKNLLEYVHQKSYHKSHAVYVILLTSFF